jgi:peroxiredoxin
MVSSVPGAGVLVEDIDLAFVPVPAEGVAAREIEGQTVLVDPSTGTVHVLNNVGSVVWNCFDGTVNLGVLTDELAEAFGAPAGVVRDDIVNLTKSLASSGLLDGVASPRPSGRKAAGVEVGAALEPFQLPDIDGAPFDLAALRGGAVLLINWSPHCGYCAQIADELASLQEALAQHGTRLVLLAAGGEEPNRALLADHGLNGTTLLSSGARSGFVHPFPGMGTPVAYLLDREGKVAAPRAYGADQVAALARRTAGQPEVAAARTDVKYLPGASGGMCGAGANTKTPRVWTANATFSIGEYHIGIRTDSATTDDVIARALAAYRSEDDPDVPANCSLVLGDSIVGQSRDLRLLLWANATVVRSRSTRRALLALAAYLSAVLPPDEHLMRTSNMAVVREGDALLLPPSARDDIERLQPRLAGIGFQIVDEPYATIDAARAELVITEPTIVIDPHVLADLDEPKLGRTELPRVEPGRYPLSAWGVWGADEPLTVAEIVSQALTSVVAEPEDVFVNLDAVEGLLGRVARLVLDDSEPEQLVEQLNAHLAGQ